MWVYDATAYVIRKRNVHTACDYSHTSVVFIPRTLRFFLLWVTHINKHLRKGA